MRAKELKQYITESAIASKRRVIKPRGEIVYDGDPRGYEWKASSIKRFFDLVEEPLRSINRRFDTLLIVRHFNQRWFLASSEGTPEVMFYFFYNAYGSQSFVYIDFQRYKTQDFIKMSAAEKTSLVSNRIPMDPAAIWNKERNIEHFGAAIEDIDSKQVDSVIKQMGAKLLNAIGKLNPTVDDITKLARFINSLIKVNSTASIKFAKECMEFFKKSTLEKLRSDLKDDWTSVLTDVARLKSKNFDWPELDTLMNDHKAEIIDGVINKMRNINIRDGIQNIKQLKQNGFNWPELDTLISDHKADIIKIILSKVKWNADSAWSLNRILDDDIKVLRTLGFDWPELDVIERSLKTGIGK